jgi:hypothetical protein
MKTAIIITAALLLIGCATVTAWIPSFWDDNQSHYIVSAQLAVEEIRCEETQQPQVQALQRQLRQFELYSTSKGTLQQDVLRVVEPMQTTLKEWQQRGEASKTYCEIKKKILLQQSQRAAKVILGRW